MKTYKISHNTKQFKEFMTLNQYDFKIHENTNWILIDAFCDTDIFDLAMEFQKWLSKQ